jgi:DNA-binding transcriptional MerR regulator
VIVEVRHTWRARQTGGIDRAAQRIGVVRSFYHADFLHAAQPKPSSVLYCQGKEGGMRIGQLARQSGLATTALRYYEKAGLLPRSPRTMSGYRTYDTQTLARLAFIQAAQAIGLTVAEIREVLAIRDNGRPPCAHVLEVIKRHRTEVRARIRQLQQLERDLARVAEQGAKVDPAECDPSGICSVIPFDPAALSPPVRTGGGGRNAQPEVESPAPMIE